MWNRTENQIKQKRYEYELILIRHGKTPSNAEHRYLGRTEEALSGEGIRELEAKKQKLCNRSVEKVFLSPMLRCRQTAALLYPEGEYIEIPEWVEMDFGIFEGKNYQDLSGNAKYQAWIDSNGTLPFPEGESREAFTERVKRGILEVCRSLAAYRAVRKEPEASGFGSGSAGSGTVAAIVHGGTIMALLSSYCGGDYFDYQVENGGGYRCRLRFGEYADCGFEESIWESMISIEIGEKL